MTDVHLVLVTDFSGSMQSNGLYREVAAGLNTLIAEQAAIDDGSRCWVSWLTFDDRTDVRYTAWDVHDFPVVDAEQTMNEHGGMTALWDALGEALVVASRWQADNPWFDGKTLVHVWTDGMENASREFTDERIKGEKAKLEADNGWHFEFHGAGIDAYALSAKGGFSRMQTNSMPNSAVAYVTSYAGVSADTRAFRSGKKANAAAVPDQPEQPDDDNVAS